MQFKETVFLFLCSSIAFGQCLETSNQEQEIHDALKRIQDKKKEAYEEMFFLKSLSVAKSTIQIGDIEERIANGLYILFQNYPEENYCQNYLGSQICPTILKSVQSAFKIAIKKWRELSMNLNRRCRSKTVREEDVDKFWGKNIKMSKTEFQENFMHEGPKRSKRVAVVIGVLLFATFMSAISWRISEAVAQKRLGPIQEQIFSIENISISTLKSTEEFMFEINLRLSLIESTIQLEAYAWQSGQEAENILNFLAPRLENQNREQFLARLDNCSGSK